MSTKHLGQENFIWWFGKVEDRNDPLQLGRVRVRIFNLHADGAAIPTDSLHWAPLVTDSTNQALKGIGKSPTGIQIGTVVLGFFMDGMECQFPVVLGTWPGITDGEHDVPALARGTNTVDKTPLGPEPGSAYQAKYPYNHVWKTESGHVIEVDDTPNYERLHTYHRSGTYSEIDHDGRRVNKIVGDDFEIVEKNKTVYVQGNVKVVIKGNADVQVQGNLSANVGGTVAINGASDIAITAAGNLALAAGGSATYDIQGSMAINATGSVKINGSTVNLN